MEFQELEILRAVIETGGFGKAAKRLLLTQSAVSQAIARMEQRVGTSLVVRSSPSKPTAAGRRVLEFAQKVFDDTHQLERDLADMQGQGSGRIRLGASQMVTNLHLDKVLPRFTKKHPHLSFDVTNVPSRELIINVRKQACELGFGPLEQQMRGLTSHIYYRQRMRLYAGESHPYFQELRSGDESALKQSVLITSYLDPVENRPNPRRLRYRFASVWQVASLNLRVELMSRGLGIGYLPEALLRSHPLGKQLKPVRKFEHGTVHREVGIYYLSNRELSPMGRLFVDFCDDYFRKKS